MDNLLIEFLFQLHAGGGTLAVHEQVCLARAGRESKVLAKDGEISQKNLTGLPSVLD